MAATPPHPPAYSSPKSQPYAQPLPQQQQQQPAILLVPNTQRQLDRDARAGRQAVVAGESAYRRLPLHTAIQPHAPPEHLRPNASAINPLATANYLRPAPSSLPPEFRAAGGGGPAIPAAAIDPRVTAGYLRPAPGTTPPEFAAPRTAAIDPRATAGYLRPAPGAVPAEFAGSFQPGTVFVQPHYGPPPPRQQQGFFGEKSGPPSYQ